MHRLSSQCYPAVLRFGLMLTTSGLALGCGSKSSSTISSTPSSRHPRSIDIPVEVCANIFNSFKCARAIERYQLESGAGAVARRDDTLIIFLASGDSVTLADTGGTDGLAFSYRQYLASLDNHLVHVQFWEGNAYLLIHAGSGRRVTIQDVPVISPDAGRFVTASADLEAGYNPNEIQIWKVRPSGMELEWNYEPARALGGSEELWGPYDPRWTGATEITINKLYFDRVADDVVVIQLETGGWTLRTTPQ